MIRTPNGLVAAGQLLVGDQVVTLSFNGLPDDYAYDGTPVIISEEDFANAEETLATVTNLGIHESVGAVVVNSDIYSMTHCIIAKRDGLIQPIMSADIIASDLIYNYNEKAFVPIENLEKNIDVTIQVYSINVEPKDFYFTENGLTYDGYPTDWTA